MSNATIITLALVAPASVIVGAVFLWRVGRRLRAAYDEAVGSYARLEPTLEQLRQDAEVARREVDGLSEALDRLAAQRADRRRGA